MRHTILIVFLAVCHVATARAQEETVIVDNIGSGVDPVSNVSLASVTMSMGTQSAYGAFKFTVPGDTDYALTAVEAPVRNGTGNGSVIVTLVNDDSNKPGTTALDVLTPSSAWPTTIPPALTTISSTQHATLIHGTSYWVMFKPANEDVTFALSLYVNLDSVTSPFAFVQDYNFPNWTVNPAAVAFRVSGTPTNLANGVACSKDDACLSGHCVDGVCCDSACGDGSDDCKACSVAKGGKVDGTCGPLDSVPAAAMVCRAAQNDCDDDVVCSDSSTSCPEVAVITCEDASTADAATPDASIPDVRKKKSGGCSMTAPSGTVPPLPIIAFLALVGCALRRRPR